MRRREQQESSFSSSRPASAAAGLLQQQRDLESTGREPHLAHLHDAEAEIILADGGEALTQLAGVFELLDVAHQVGCALKGPNVGWSEVKPKEMVVTHLNGGHA